MRIKIAKLSAIAFSVAFVLSLSHLGTPGVTRAADQAQEQSQIDVLGRGSTMAERIGTDDGAAFVIHFSGDRHGNLDSCG
jgi:hypothetical protein